MKKLIILSVLFLGGCQSSGPWYIPQIVYNIYSDATRVKYHCKDRELDNYYPRMYEPDPNVYNCKAIDKYNVLCKKIGLF